MVATIFQPFALLAMLLVGVGGFILALIVRLVKGDAGSAAALRGLEAFAAGLIGAFLAHTFIALMMAAGHHSDVTVAMTSLFFFIWPGVVNVIALLATHHLAINEAGVLWIALFVGGLVGVMDGLWASHQWAGLGLIAFPLDVTWGLGGSTNGLLLHLINTFMTEHADGDSEIRQEAHRYIKGFRMKEDFAFTQGAVMSDMGGWSPGTDLFHHELLHVWQNRILGPFFWFTYAAWMLVTLIPSLIAGAIGSAVGDALQYWTYFNNPWEVMAYGIANPTGRTGWNKPDWLCWPWPVAIALGAIGVAGISVLVVFLFKIAY